MIALTIIPTMHTQYCVTNLENTSLQRCIACNAIQSKMATRESSKMADMVWKGVLQTAFAKEFFFIRGGVV